MNLFLKKDPLLFVYAYISISKQGKKIKKKLRKIGWIWSGVLIDGYSNSFIFAG